jgi:hypothetical protein
MFPRPTKEQVQDSYPNKFKDKYPGKFVREVIDATELFIQIPTCPNAQYWTWSDYKGNNTIKILVAVTPAGYISWISPCYPGRIQDKDIVACSGYLDALEFGDHVMADKGFNIRDMLVLRGCDLIVPPKKGNNQDFTTEQILKTRTVANLRIHVERWMQLFKQFKFLHRTLPINMLDISSKIVNVAAKLTLQWAPLVGDDFAN